jgi:Uncharacterised MFS-type transporter YbfB
VVSGPRAAIVGLFALAAAMGIGRFGFTPLLPLMLAEGALGLREGSWLAAANYAGYLAGALWVMVRPLPPAQAVRGGLLVVVLGTAGMALVSGWLPWLLLRLLAGVASAFVLVGVSGWALAALVAAGRAALSGWVYAGVGCGILAAGLLVLALAAAGASAAMGWLALAAVAMLLTGVVVRTVRPVAGPTAAARALTLAPPLAIDRSTALCIVAYGALGLGYIIPATYLPAVAKAQLADVSVFGWIWPVFGAAAAASTVLAARLAARLPPRLLWAAAQGLMALGVALPALDTRLPALLASALLVGGTFMVITMAGMQHARERGGAAAPRLMAAFTAAFAAGQLVGPLLLPAAADAASAVRLPSLVAAAVLVLTALPLLAPAQAPGRPGATGRDSDTIGRHDAAP